MIHDQAGLKIFLVEINKTQEKTKIFINFISLKKRAYKFAQ
jgi:hypothetical protein